MGFHKGIDYFKFATHEDVVSQDSYPDTYEPDWMAQAGMVCDLIRSVGESPSVDFDGASHITSQLAAAQCQSNVQA